MNTSGSAYTTLESLLLFQCLRTYGVANTVFGRISDLLKNNPDITSHKYYQSGRLSPDALRAFYLERLRKEIENEVGADTDDTNGDGANPRKRKKTSPALPGVQESLNHQHLIPKLVNKLYASYRNEITEQIRADEERRERLQHELKSIQRGEWDEQLKERASAKSTASRSPTTSKKSPSLAQKPLQPNTGGQQGQVGVRDGPDGGQQPVLEPSKPSTLQNGQPAASPRKKNMPPEQQQGAPAASQPLAASVSPQQGQAPLAPSSRHQQQPSTGYNGTPYANISPLPPGQQSHAPHNVPLQPSPQQNHARPSHHPSPVTMAPGPPYQSQPMPPYGNNGMPQYAPPPGAPSPYSPSHQRFPQQPAGPQSPSVQVPHQQGRPHYPHQAPQAQYAQPLPQSGYMLPPFQVSPQDPSRVHPQTAATPQYPNVSTPVSNKNSHPSTRSNVQTPMSGRPAAPPMHPLVTQARHNYSTPVNSRSPQSAFGTPVSAKSKWKSQSLKSGSASASPRPVPESIDDFTPLSSSHQSPPKSKSQRKSRGRGKGKEKELDQPNVEQPSSEVQTPSGPPADEPVAEPETRSGRSRRRAAPKRTRPGSIASSRAGGSVRDRSRSPSVISHTDTVAADNESQAGHRIKLERGTSVDVIEEEVTDTPSVTTRRRGATMTRRKRNAREASLEEPEEQSSSHGLPKHIVAPRHFARTSVPIMNDIQSHKHASTFGTAVKAKDAEGYYDLIKRPTDLKSIQKAIANGSKQVAAAASDTPVGSPGGGGSVVELPVTLDNIPPKSIVNAAQLEKELMRMFVNAVMFNPGEDGVVDDAREMFETVQRSVSSWRNVERSSGRTEVEDTPTIDEEEVQQVPSKRRKV